MLDRKSSARRLISLSVSTIVGATLVPVRPLHAWEPTRPVEFVIPAGTGGGADLMARFVAAVIQKEPMALQLRYLQTLVELGTEKNTTIVFPLPIDIISSLGRLLENAAKSSERT